MPIIIVFSVIASIFAFCVLDFISDTSLFCNGFANFLGQQTLFYIEVSFFSPAFFGAPILRSYRKLSAVENPQAEHVFRDNDHVIIMP